MQLTQMHMRRFRHQTTSQMLYSDAYRKRNQMQVFCQEWVKNWVLKLPWWHLSNLCWYDVCLLCYLHCLRQMNTVLNCFLCFVLVSTVSTHSECTYYIWVEVTPSLSAQVFLCPCLSTMFWAMRSPKRFVRGLALPQANLSWTRLKSSLQGRNVHLTTREHS